MKVVDSPIALAELRGMAERSFGVLVKAVVDVERALELIDLTLLTVGGVESRLRELTRTREALVDYFYFDNRYGSTDALWKRQFDAFAHAAAVGAWRKAP